MKKLVCFFLWLLLLGANARAEERITNFVSNVIVNKDASLLVIEEITVVAEGNHIKRGIYRDFPTKYKMTDGSKRKVGFEVLEVMRDGQQENFHIEDRGRGWKRVYIGNKNIYLSQGTYTYTIKYKTDRQIRYFNNYDEVYWNATGDQWSFPIERAEARITLPQGTPLLLSAAYTGKRGSKDNDVSVLSFESAKYFTTTRRLEAGEGLTVAVSFPKNVVAPEKSAFFSDNAGIIAIVLSIIAVTIYYVIAWYKVGIDPEKRTVIPLFQPPKGFSAGLCGYLSKQGFGFGGHDTESFSATVISLAVKDYIKIEKIADNNFFLMRPAHMYKLIKLKDFSDGGLSKDELAVANGIFTFGAESVVIGKKDDTKVRDALAAYKKQISSEVKGQYLNFNSFYLVIGILLTLFCIMLIIAFSDEEILKAIVMITAIMMPLFSVLFGITSLIKSKARLIPVTMALGVVLVIAFVFTKEYADIVFSVAGTVVLMGINFLFAVLLKAPTQMGQLVSEQIEGFKMFLTVAEEKRLESYYPPDVTPQVFEKYLPYAMALGVSNEWGAKFASYMAAASIAAYTPHWYVGDSFSPDSIGSLGESITGGLTESLSVSSSDSGSGGGGFSGGGGGGGGGGGW